MSKLYVIFAFEALQFRNEGTYLKYETVLEAFMILLTTHEI